MNVCLPLNVYNIFVLKTLKLSLTLWPHTTGASLLVPVFQVGRAATTAAISACGPPWGFTRLRATGFHSSTARFVLLMCTVLCFITQSYFNLSVGMEVGFCTPEYHHNLVGNQKFPKFWFCRYWFESYYISDSGRLRASCVSRSQLRPWPRCLMAWLAFSCCCATGARCHARALCINPSTPSLWSVEISIWKGKMCTSVFLCSINGSLFSFL